MPFFQVIWHGIAKLRLNRLGKNWRPILDTLRLKIICGTFVSLMRWERLGESQMPDTYQPATKVQLST